jgi:hypothetical protein
MVEIKNRMMSTSVEKDCMFMSLGNRVISYLNLNKVTGSKFGYTIAMKLVIFPIKPDLIYI